MVSVTKYFVSLGAVIVTVGEGVVPVGDSAQGSRVFAMLPQQAPPYVSKFSLRVALKYPAAIAGGIGRMLK